MFEYLGYLIFILSVALSAGGIILSSRLRSRNGAGIYSTLLYYQVFIYAFGFYGIWGQVVARMFLSSLIPPDILIRVNNITTLLGLPFLIFAWLMLIRFSGILSGRKSNNWFIAGFLLSNFIILAVLGYFFMTRLNSRNTVLIIRNYYILMNLVHTFITAYLIHLPVKGKSLIKEHDRKVIAPAIFLIMIIQCIPLVLIDLSPWVAIIFIFTFFLGNIFLPVYFSYLIISPVIIDRTNNFLTLEQFCKRFDISPRESEVVREICSGLSNREISDKLFISLQTVKDHTHRIYIKTNVKSRVQLINLVNDMVK
ncbi:MAG TPA: helix-turn-helix transcriptional regulator [Bacteroidales bacterium]|nr:helix-turn-helix transcriptional regulator [Bacteroidales bacterium]